MAKNNEEKIDVNEVKTTAMAVQGSNDLALQGEGEKSNNGISVQASVNFTFLNVEFTGAYQNSTIEKEKKPDGSRVTETLNQVLVMPTDKPKGGMTIQQLINDANNFVKEFTGTTDGQISSEDVTKNIEEFKLGVLDKILVDLRQVFLYIKKVTTKNIDKDGNVVGTPVEVKTMEYAINFVIKSSIAPNIQLFRIDSLSLAIWNTQRPKILERMQLGDIEALLNS